jgi:hypothetical protein
MTKIEEREDEKNFDATHEWKKEKGWKRKT